MVKAILFDAFGTLCEICDKRNPYKPIVKGWPFGVADAYHALMTKKVLASELAIEAGCSLKLIEQIEAGIRAEIASMRLYPEVVMVLTRIRQSGLKWAIVSNLAMPYAEPLLKLLPLQPDACVWSFAVGHRKPEQEIYYHTCKVLDLAPSEALMVGDSFENDYAMPKKIGMQARYLKRSDKDKTMQECLANLAESLE